MLKSKKICIKNLTVEISTAISRTLTLTETGMKNLFAPISLINLILILVVGVLADSGYKGR